MTSIHVDNALAGSSFVSDSGSELSIAGLKEQLARYAEDFGMLAAEFRLLRSRQAHESPESEIASRIQGAFADMVRTLSSFGFVVIDQDGVITHATLQAEKLFGLETRTLIGARLTELIKASAGRPLAQELFDLASGQRGRIEKLAVHAVRGSHAMLFLHALRAEPPSSESLLCLLRPAAATEVERPVQQLLLADVFAGTSDAWMVANHMRRIIGVNAGFTATTGYEASEVVGRTPHVLSSGRHGPEFYAQMWQTIDAEGEWQGEICNRRRNGELYEEWLHISAYRDRAGQVCGYVALFYDLMFARKAYERIDYLVHTDALTKLPNRALFLDRLAQAVQRARDQRQPFAILAIDIDHFREVNDTLGHDVGDHILVTVALALQRAAGAEMLVARLGGDEFVVLAMGNDCARMTTLIAALRAGLASPAVHAGRELYVSLSAGIAAFPDHGGSASTLLRNAEIALDTAKRNGGNCTQIYEDELSRRRMARFSLTSALRQALEKQQLHLVYQPQVAAASGAITGVEALLRWSIPGQKDISPAEFIPLAEETGLIVPIGAWVLEQACLQQVAWRKRGLRPVRVAVNIAGRQLREPGFGAQVAAVVERCGADPRYLEIEVTESELMDEVDNAAEVLVQLRASGIGIAVDDFGTGHSSLGRLHHLAIDRLKIDRSFVFAMGGDERSSAIPRTILTLAASLGLEVVAEGVETEAQAAMLREWGCQELQGYLFSRPVHADQIAAMLA